MVWFRRILKSLTHTRARKHNFHHHITVNDTFRRAREANIDYMQLEKSGFHTDILRHFNLLLEDAVANEWSLWSSGIWITLDLKVLAWHYVAFIGTDEMTHYFLYQLIMQNNFCCAHDRHQTHHIEQEREKLTYRKAEGDNDSRSAHKPDSCLTHSCTLFPPNRQWNLPLIFWQVIQCTLEIQ